MTDHTNLIDRLQSAAASCRERSARELMAQAVNALETIQAKVVQLKVDAASDYATQQELRAEVERLKGEITNLKAYAKHERSLGAESFAIENNDLKQELQEAKESVSDLRAAAHILASERDAAKARITALEKQEPVAIVRRCRDEGVIINGNNDEISVNLPPGTKLYLAAGAAPTKEQT